MRTPILMALFAMFFCSGAFALPQEPDFLTQREAWRQAQIRCLRDAVYAEARGEDDFGQRMVAWVVAQRALANKPYWGGGTICKVVYAVKRNQKGQIVTSQFSGPVYYPVSVSDADPQLQRAARNANAVLLENWRPPLHWRKARFYQNPTHANPKRRVWFKGTVGSVGNHVFYTG